MRSPRRWGRWIIPVTVECCAVACVFAGAALVGTGCRPSIPNGEDASRVEVGRATAASGAEPKTPPPALLPSAPANDSADALAACGVDAGPDATTHLAAAPCAKNDDCVLTEAVVACEACNTGKLYAARKLDVTAHDERCASRRCVPTGCPPVDTYTPAFWRAECRGGTCVRFRWHSGG